MKKVVTFGEIMMRLNPQGYNRFIQSSNFEISYAGGEANVAVSLANYGIASEFVTKLPDNELGTSALNAVRRYGVKTDNIIRGEGRLGLYFLEKGASQRASKVIYDRANSVIALAQVRDFDWEKIFENATWFHFTGITPALGGENPAICLAACKEAKKRGITISCDINYRNKLWSKAEANKVMSELMQYVDVCISNEEDAADVFNITAGTTDVHSGKLDHNAYISVAQQIVERFGCKKVAVTLRTSLSASVNKWAGMLYTGKDAFFSPEYTIQIVDRVGGGDSFGGGLIYSQISNYTDQDSINFAVAASCLKHTIEGDFNLMSVKEVQTLAQGNASGRVQR